MEISLTKLPWYAQIGAFVVLALAGVGAFYYYYERRCGRTWPCARRSCWRCAPTSQGLRDREAPAGVPQPGHASSKAGSTI